MHTLYSNVLYCRVLCTVVYYTVLYCTALLCGGVVGVVRIKLFPAFFSDTRIGREWHLLHFSPVTMVPSLRLPTPHSWWVQSRKPYCRPVVLRKARGPSGEQPMWTKNVGLVAIKECIEIVCLGGYVSLEFALPCSRYAY